MLGGFLFGFSSYVIGQVEDGHPHMSSVFLLPLVALVVLRFLDGRTGGRGSSLELGVMLAFQILLSTEVAFTLTLAVVGRVAARIPARPGSPPTDQGASARTWPAPTCWQALLTAPFLYYALTGSRRRVQPSQRPRQSTS